MNLGAQAKETWKQNIFTLTKNFSMKKMEAWPMWKQKQTNKNEANKEIKYPFSVKFAPE